MEPEGSSPCSHVLCICTYPELDESSLYILILSTHLRLRLPSDLFLFGFPTNILQFSMNSKFTVEVLTVL
jgi:hypothetical protein